MTTAVLGSRESQTVEFTSRDALKDLPEIAREVVAMLNAEGGEVWIGVREEAGRAIAIEPIANLEAEVRRLRDHLIDTIEPSPNEREVTVSEGGTAEGLLIRIAVKPEQRRKPYARTGRSARLYVTRVEDRLRSLTRDEIAEAFTKTAETGVPHDEGEACKLLEQELTWELERPATGARQLFWLRLLPSGKAELDLGRVRQSGLLTDRDRTGGERFMASFTDAYAWGRQEPEVKQGQLVVGKEGDYWLVVDRASGLGFTAPLESLRANPVLPGELLLYSLHLLEYPISVLRLAGALSADPNLWERPDRVPALWTAHMALFGLRGWTLRPGTPDPWGALTARAPAKPFPDDYFALDRPLVFSTQQVREEPDRCAFRLVARLYEAFGYSEDAIPRQFDRRSGRYSPQSD